MNEEAGEGYRLVDHTSEVTLRLQGKTFADLVVQATRAFVSLVPEDARGPVAGERRTVEIDEGDRTATLVAWLNELVFLAEVEGWLPWEPTVERIADAGIRVRSRALELREPFVLVKAATLHEAEIRDLGHFLEVEITLDV